MGKDFNTWNNLKKQIDSKSFLPLFSEKEIWWCSVGINVGREEDGKNELYERPVLVFKKINKESFVGMPLNSQVKDNDFYFKYFFNDKERIIKINQIKTFSANRLIRRMGKMSEDEFLQLVNQVNKTLVQQDETPFLHGVSQAPFGVSNISIAPPQNLSTIHRSFNVSQQAVFLNKSKEVMILQSREDTNKWLLPGGRIDESENNWELALRREIKEELKIVDFKILQTIASDFSTGFSCAAVAHLCSVDEPELQKISLSKDHIQIKWVKAEELEKYLYYKKIAKEIKNYFLNK